MSKRPTPDLDTRVLEGCRQRDRTAQQQLYRYYYGEMMAICLRYTSNPDEAAEVLNDGFLKVFHKIKHFEPTYSLRAWVRRIMVNTAIDHYRQNKKHQHVLNLEYAVEESVEDHVVEQLSEQEIMQLVQKLPNSYRVVFNLYVVEGFSHPEISEKLGIAEGTSKSHLSKARGKLQTMIRRLYRSDYEKYAG